jgi:CheY-like chemotaxis protein
MRDVINCLLVDDDQDDREIFLLALNGFEHVRCQTAGNGVDALHMLAEGTEIPDVIFLDMNMPRMNGLECLQRIREQHRFDDCRIYIYTTNEDPGIVRRSEELNASCIVKPMSMKTLRELLSTMLDK